MINNICLSFPDKNKCVKEESNEELEAKAAAIIQKRYREHAASKYNLTEQQKKFIRPWYKRWRTKSIFQVLLLYRAERLQTIVNFCLQIHVYNQNCINDIQKTIPGVNLDEVDSNATPKEYLPPSKPTIPKLLFMWESLKLRGDVSNCEKLPDCDLEQLELEIFNKLIKKRNEVLEDAKKAPKNYEDKEIQTCLSSDDSSQSKELPKTDLKETKEETNVKTPIPDEFHKESVQKEKLHNDLEKTIEPVSKSEQNTIVNLTMIKSALDNLRQNDEEEKKPEKEDCDDNFQETRIQALQSRPSSKKIQNKVEAKQNQEQKLRKSINEMEEKFRNTNYDENDDNPPFNFKAMLKKTNYTKPIHSPDDTVAFHNEINTFLQKKRKSLNCRKFDDISQQQEKVSVELAPGILIHGKIADL